jgi:xanthine/uracil permease
MKVFSIILIVSGLLFLFVGLIFNRLNWPDLWRGVLTGPIIILIGITFRIYLKKSKNG